MRSGPGQPSPAPLADEHRLASDVRAPRRVRSRPLRVRRISRPPTGVDRSHEPSQVALATRTRWRERSRVDSRPGSRIGSSVRAWRYWRRESESNRRTRLCGRILSLPINGLPNCHEERSQTMGHALAEIRSPLARQDRCPTPRARSRVMVAVDAHASTWAGSTQVASTVKAVRRTTRVACNFAVRPQPRLTTSRRAAGRPSAANAPSRQSTRHSSAPVIAPGTTGLEGVAVIRSAEFTRRGRSGTRTRPTACRPFFTLPCAPSAEARPRRGAGTFRARSRRRAE